MVFVVDVDDNIVIVDVGIDVFNIFFIVDTRIPPSKRVKIRSVTAEILCNYVSIPPYKYASKKGVYIKVCMY